MNDRLCRHGLLLHEWNFRCWVAAKGFFFVSRFGKKIGQVVLLNLVTVGRLLRDISGLYGPGRVLYETKHRSGVCMM